MIKNLAKDGKINMNKGDNAQKNIDETMQMHFKINKPLQAREMISLQTNLIAERKAEKRQAMQSQPPVLQNFVSFAPENDQKEEHQFTEFNQRQVVDTQMN